jgi:acyl-CoA synthetase (AMP-forming)/AMP-acid ligase II/acyl carrier protein
VNGPPDRSAGVLDQLRDLAIQRPGAPALFGASGAHLGRVALMAQVDGTIAALADQGLGGVDRVAIVLPDSPMMAAVLLAVSSHATAAPINPRYTADEIAFVLTDTAARAVIVHADPGATGHRAAVEAARRVGCAVITAEPLGDDGRSALGGAAGPLGAGSAGAAAGTAIVLHTSGTTARPKLVGLQRAQLALTAAAIGRSLALGPEDRSLVVMPLFHVHGIVAGALAPLVAGGEVVVPTGHTPGDLARLVGECSPTWLTAVPSMLQTLLASAEREMPVHRLRVLRSCSSPLPPAVGAALEQRFGVPVVEAYGMTEAAHQVASNPLPPAVRKPGSVGLATGPEVTVVDDDGVPVAPGTTGHVLLRGPSIIGAYLDNPAANEASFVDGWFRTGDLGRLDEEGYLFLAGRSKELVNRAGEKIAPREVEDVLSSHPAVAQAVVFAVPDRRLGEQVAAAVVLREPVDEHELRKHVAASLAAFKVPRRIVACDSIPLGPTGKVQRMVLAEKLGLADLDDVGPVLPARTPSGPVEDLVASLWTQVLDREVTDANARFMTLGGDSLRAVRLLARLRDELDVPLSLVELSDAPTVAGQAELIERLLLDDR